MNKYVNKFAIAKATYTRNGKPEKLIFNISNSSKFKDKIIYGVIDNESPNIDAINENDDE